MLRGALDRKLHRPEEQVGTLSGSLCHNSMMARRRVCEWSKHKRHVNVQRQAFLSTLRSWKTSRALHECNLLNLASFCIWSGCHLMNTPIVTVKYNQVSQDSPVAYKNGSLDKLMPLPNIIQILCVFLVTQMIIVSIICTILFLHFLK